MLKRIAPDYEVRVVQPVDFERGFLSKQDIAKYFDILKNLKIDTILPKLIINLDETGFGGSVSGRKNPMKYIVSRNFKGKLRYQYQEASNHITSLVGITASGTILFSCTIIKRGTENQDGVSCPYFNKMQMYCSPNAFITRKIFEHSVQNTVIEYIQKVREEVGDPNLSALIIYDGLKGHLSDILFSKCAEQNIYIVLIPSRSSHLLQPLDQGVFRSMKSKFSTVPKWTNKSQITTKLQQIYTVIQMTNNEQVILQSWSHLGIVPKIENGEVIKVELDKNKIYNNETIVSDKTHNINERSRGEKTNKAEFGLMNESEIERVKSGCYPLCGTQINPKKDESEDNDN